VSSHLQQAYSCCTSLCSWTRLGLVQSIKEELTRRSRKQHALPDILVLVAPRRIPQRRVAPAALCACCTAHTDCCMCGTDSTCGVYTHTVHSYCVYTHTVHSYCVYTHTVHSYCVYTHTAQLTQSVCVAYIDSYTHTIRVSYTHTAQRVVAPATGALQPHGAPAREGGRNAAVRV
jgi:hypothetical protein